MSLFSSNEEHFCTPFAIHSKTNARLGQIDNTQLEPENEYGNVEYKLKLTDPSPERVERLVTQLKWRIREGNGEAILFLGVKDNGMFVGLSPEELRLSLRTLERMSAKIGASMTVVRERIVDPDPNEECILDEPTNAKGKIIRNRSNLSHQQKENSTSSQQTTEAPRKGFSKYQKKHGVRKVIQVLVKRKTQDISEELRVAVLGPTESGKSSLLGVLSRGEYDNGRGSARLNLFRHRHEIRSGHTSSISQEIIGFTSDGLPITYSTCLTTQEIIESSSKIVTLIDLAGHQRYLGTTLFGLGSYSPDVVLLVVSATSVITDSIADHVSLALGMDKRLAIVINKIDLVSNETQEKRYIEIVKLLETLSPENTTLRIAGLDDALIAGAATRDSKTTIPIFTTSCITGDGLDCLYQFFNETSPMCDFEDLDQAVSQPSELQVDETFAIPNIGTVVSGLVTGGVIREGDEMLLGPDDRGDFFNVSIVSLQRHKVPCNFARVGQKCTMAIDMSKDLKVRRGMVMKEVENDWRSKFTICYQFRASVKFITNIQHKLNCGSQVSAYIGNVKQTCTIMSITRSGLSTWLLDLKLAMRPEYIREGSKVILRHALIKGIGRVVQVKPMSSG